jgi:hypothetical protein
MVDKTDKILFTPHFRGKQTPIHCRAHQVNSAPICIPGRFPRTCKTTVGGQCPSHSCDDETHCEHLHDASPSARKRPLICLSSHAVSPKRSGPESENPDTVRAAQSRQNPSSRIHATQGSMPVMRPDSEIWDTDRRISDEAMKTITHQPFQ